MAANNMQLLIDIGNTREKLAIVSDNQITAVTNPSATTVSGLPIQKVLYATVASEQRTEALKCVLALEHLSWQQIQSESQAFGVINSYSEPKRLGVDRWLAMLGVNRLYPDKSVLIVDAGTAVTVDWLSAKGVHQGGWILPGFIMQQQSVLNHTARVLAAAQRSADIQPGTDTESGLKNGCLATIIGAIRFAWQSKPTDVVVLTGGDTDLLMPHLLDLPLYTEPMLIFQGLARYANV